MYIRPGLGAFSVIAETEPAYALNGFEQLRQGRSIREAIESTREKDPEAYLLPGVGDRQPLQLLCFYRVDLEISERLLAGSMTGKGYVVMGNQLGDSVLQAMASGFERASGTLAQRLLAALVAGERAGGQVSGKQSAALAVKGTNNDFFNNIDLRVDDSGDPFSDLQRLLNYHYGRIRLNQTITAIGMGNIQRGGGSAARRGRNGKRMEWNAE